MATLAFLLMLTVVPGAAAQTAAPGLPSELAARIADAVVPATEIALTVSAAGNGEAQRVDISSQLVQALRARGIRATDPASGIASVTVSCGSNLRELACIAEIVRPDRDRVIAAVTRPYGAENADRRPRLSLELARLFGQRAPILDTVLASDRLLVLDPGTLTVYRVGGSGWQRGNSRAVSSRRPWPRDVRGRIKLEGASVEVFLPGVSCRGDADVTRLSCAEDQAPWPLGIDNSGLDASRNFFSTPEGLPFYGVAPLGDADGSGIPWLVADRFGALTFLDGSRQLAATAGRGDDVVALRSPCGGGGFVVASSRKRGDHTDSLQLFRIVERQLVPAAAPRDLPGSTTALWAAPGAMVATVVTHDSGADRYEAFQVRIGCDW